MGDVPLETGDVPLIETPQLCGISELLRGDLFDCTTLDLQASRLVNSNSSGSATQHLQRLSQLLGEGGVAATPRLRSLVLSGIHVGDQGAEYLYGALMHPTVLALRMDSCGISKQGAFAVASALNGGAAMRSLSLSWNALGPSGGIAIAVELRRNGSRLSRLYLSHCELGAEGEVDQLHFQFLPVHRRRVGREMAVENLRGLARFHEEHDFTSPKDQ